MNFEIIEVIFIFLIIINFSIEIIKKLNYINYVYISKYKHRKFHTKLLDVSKEINYLKIIQKFTLNDRKYFIGSCFLAQTIN